jgi:hypothetical protein
VSDQNGAESERRVDIPAILVVPDVSPIRLADEKPLTRQIGQHTGTAGDVAHQVLLQDAAPSEKAENTGRRRVGEDAKMEYFISNSDGLATILHYAGECQIGRKPNTRNVFTT